MSILETILQLLMMAYAWLVPTMSVPQPEPVATTSATVISVIDGDTITVSIAGHKETIRYIGIDTSESYREGLPECGSAEATAENTRLVAGKIVELVADQEDKDKYGRLLRYVYVDGEMVNVALVRGGFAAPLTIPPNTTHAELFTAEGKTAKANHVGNWLLCPK
jgi:micrococcal nuclease